MAIELISFDELKTFLGLIETESDYPELALIQESVVSAIEDTTGRILEQGDYTQTKHSFWTDTVMIKLDAIPVLKVESVTIDGAAVSGYKIRTYGLDLPRTVFEETVVVKYTGGVDAVSGTLKRAALLQTVYEFQHKEFVGVETISTEGGTVTRPALGMLKEVAKLLEKERHPYPVF